MYKMINTTTDVVPAESPDCVDIVNHKYDVVISIICSVLALFGLVYTYFGYRCFKAVMFMSGLIFGGITVYMLCREEKIFQETVTLEIAAGIAAGIGVLCGFITMLVRYIGLFLQGFFLGILLAFAGILTVQSFYHPTTAWIPVAILFGSGIVFSLLTLKFQKFFIVISTAVLGSVLITACIDYFLEDFVLFNYAWDALMASPSDKLCWYTWVILSVWPALSFTGILLQWKVTSKGYDHTDVLIPRGRRKQVRTHLVRPRQHSRQMPETLQARHSRSRTVVNRQQTSAPTRQSQHASVAQPRRNQAVSHPPREVSRHIETEEPPPSYYECVHLGVGDPIPNTNNPNRTRPSRNCQELSTTSGNLAQELTSGQGYIINNEQSSSRGGYVASSRSRTDDANRPAVTREPIHEPVDQHSVSNRSKPYRRQKTTTGKRSRVSPSTSVIQGIRGSSESQQRLLENSGPSQTNRDALTAHARRLHAVRNRQTGQVQATTQHSTRSLL